MDLIGPLLKLKGIIRGAAGAHLNTPALAMTGITSAAMKPSSLDIWSQRQPFMVHPCTPPHHSLGLNEECSTEAASGGVPGRHGEPRDPLELPQEPNGMRFRWILSYFGEAACFLVRLDKQLADAASDINTAHGVQKS